MNSRVQAYLNAHRHLPTYEHRAVAVHHPEKWAAYQQDVLLLAGLFDKIYHSQHTGEFCYVESDPKSGMIRYYKRQAIAVTEEEFRLIQQYSPIAYNE
ncbi:MAG: hypothetical protein IJP35_07825 [Clostridia bacterium]|nr:hypothetical protein [Clostridia bacterium]